MGDIRLLIVDDSAEIRSVLREIAERNHYSVVGEAENGREALQIVPQVDADVILLDASMPVMGGFETARNLGKIAPKTPIIFVSQHGDRPYVDAALSAGARGYVLKSVIASELRPAIECVRRGATYCSCATAPERDGAGSAA